MNSSSDLPSPRPSVSVNYVLLVALIAGVVALGYWLRPERPVLSEWIGQNIEIQFRRNALGAAERLADQSGYRTNQRRVDIDHWSFAKRFRFRNRHYAIEGQSGGTSILDTSGSDPFHPSRSVTNVLWIRRAASAASQRPEVEKPAGVRRNQYSSARCKMLCPLCVRICRSRRCPTCRKPAIA